MEIFVFKTIQFCRELRSKPSSSGQALLEYIFLVVIVFLLSLVLLKGVGGSLGELWKFVVGKIVYPTQIDFQ